MLEKLQQNHLMVFCTKLTQGPILLMIENYLTGLIRDIMKKCPYPLAGLQRAGFKRGWLSASAGKND
jgi:hypothetical protein